MLKQIAVIGSDGKVTADVELIAEEVGQGIAHRGAVLISGGRGGVMEASCRGAKKENGLVIGILPRTRDQANRYVDVAIVTDMGNARNALNVNSADSVISICGGSGTLSEIGLALKANKRVVALKSSGGVTSMLAGISIGKNRVIQVDSVEEALRMAFE